MQYITRAYLFIEYHTIKRSAQITSSLSLFQGLTRVYAKYKIVKKI